ncbi:MAG: conjugal transfer protein TrbE, partial [Granulosicoccus sp.]|nr:conjugal transfer protein TrbE [Granulosicoccus sp.]
MALPGFSWLFNDEGDIAYVDLMQFRAYRDFDEGIIDCKDGELMVAWTYTGIDHESATDQELNFLSYRLNDLVKSLGRGWVSWTESLRVQTRAYPERSDCHFPDPVSRMIDEERRIAVLEQDDHYETVAFIVLMYKPPSKTTQRLVDAMVDEPEVAIHRSLDEKQLLYFKRAIAQFERALDSLFPSMRLRPYVDEDGYTYCDFARLLHYCATGVMRPVRIPDRHVSLDCLICGQDFIPSHNPLVGDQYIGVVSVEGIPSFTHPAMLAAFDSRPLKYRWSTRYIYMDRIEAVESLSAFHRRWSQQVISARDQLVQNPNPRLNLDAQRMVQDAAEAAAEVASGDVNQGLYTSVFVVYSESLDEVQDACEYFRNYLNNENFSGGRIERTNATEAFLGSIPGNTGANVTRAQISTANLADLLPVASAWPGEEYCPCDQYPPFSPPLIQAETPSSTPFRLNLHVSDVGHTLIIGATGSGKSTLLCLIEAQFLKYPHAQVFTFDAGLSMYAVCKGVGGRHFDIGGESAPGVAQESLMPLQHIDTAGDLAWTVNWVETCIELQGMTITPARHRAIDNALKLLRESPRRTITEFRANLQDVALREAMSFYSIGGTAGYLLDGESESTEFNHFNVFEIGELMSLGDRIALPVLDYLFRRIEKSLDGRPTLVPLDECWLAFRHTLFRDKLMAWLKTFRKANAAVVMATQSVADAIRSGIVETILDSTATRILLPHPDVALESNRAFYTNTLGLNSTELTLLAAGIPKSQYYYTSVLGRRLFELNLRPKTLAYVGRSTPEDVATLKALIADYPDTWREQW